MPSIPLPPTDPKEREKNIKEQYEALGRFVEAFELMVDEVRGTCVDRIWEAITANTGLEYELDRSFRKGLVETSFHQQSMTAKPLWDTMRAIIAEIIFQQNSPHHADYERPFRNLLSASLHSGGSSGLSPLGLRAALRIADGAFVAARAIPIAPILLGQR